MDQNAHSQTTLSRLPNGVLSRQLDDASGFSEIFARWNGQFHQMSRGKFQGSIDVVSGQMVRLFQAKTNQAILTRGMDSEFATFIPITSRNAATRWSGRKLNRGDLIAKFPEAEYNNQTIPDTSIRALLVPVRTLQEMTCILAGGSPEVEFAHVECSAAGTSGNGTVRTRTCPTAHYFASVPEDCWRRGRKIA